MWIGAKTKNSLPESGGAVCASGADGVVPYNAKPPLKPAKRSLLSEQSGAPARNVMNHPAAPLQAQLPLLT